MRSPDTPPLSIALVGCGDIARKAYLPLLRTWPGTHIAGVFSRTQETVDRCCQDWQIDDGTTNLHALIDKRPQAAFVLSHTLAHYEHVKTLLEAGIDVFVEKPATAASAETRQLAELAFSSGRIFMVGFNRRYALLYRQAKEIFGDRRVQLCIVEKHRTSAFHISLFNNYLDDTIHQIDLLRFFCGEAQPVHTSFEMHNGKMTGATSIVKLENGGGNAVILTSLEAGRWQERLTLMGDGMTVEVNAFRELRIRSPQKDEVFGVDRPGRWLPELKERGFSGEIEHFFDCVRERAVPYPDGFDAARTQELVEGLTTIAGEQAIMTPYSTPYV